MSTAMAPPGPVHAARARVKVCTMTSRRRPLLVVLLILSLLLNGLNHALASGPAYAPETHHAAGDHGGGDQVSGDIAATAHDRHDQHAGHTAHAATPPCHEKSSVVSASHGDDGHCAIKDCVRACAQQPVMESIAIALPARLAPATGALPLTSTAFPAPLLPRPSRPPIA